MSSLHADRLQEFLVTNSGAEVPGTDDFGDQSANARDSLPVVEPALKALLSTGF